MNLSIDQTYKGFTWVQVGWRMITRKSTLGRPSVKIRTHSLVSNIYVDVINHDLCLFPHPSQSRVNLHQDPNNLNILQRKESIVLHVDQNYYRFMKLFLWPLCPKTNILYSRRVCDRKSDFVTVIWSTVILPEDDASLSQWSKSHVNFATWCKCYNYHFQVYDSS